MEINSRSWGTVIICKNSDEKQKQKRYDRQRSLSVNNVTHKMDLNQLYDLVYLLIELTKKRDYNQLKKELGIIGSKQWTEEY